MSVLFFGFWKSADDDDDDGDDDDVMSSRDFKISSIIPGSGVVLVSVLDEHDVLVSSLLVRTDFVSFS